MSLIEQDRARVAAIMAHPSTLATVLYSLAVREFGEEVHSWEPETVALEINDTFHIEFPEENHNKLMALLTAIDADAFYKKWPAFELTCRAINSGTVYGGDDLLVAEMAWAVAEVQLNDDTPQEFSHEIAAGVGRLLASEGFVRPPPKLGFARIPERYHGSDTPGDLGQQSGISTEHENVVKEYLQEQAALLVKQISALPWHNEESLVKVIEEMTSAASGHPGR